MGGKGKHTPVRRRPPAGGGGGLSSTLPVNGGKGEGLSRSTSTLPPPPANRKGSMVALAGSPRSPSSLLLLPPLEQDPFSWEGTPMALPSGDPSPRDEGTVWNKKASFALDEPRTAWASPGPGR